MKHDEFIGIRVPKELRGSLERERRRMSKSVGAEVKMSAVIRSILERAMKPKRRLTSSRAAEANAGG